MAKKLTRLQRSTEILKEAVESKWCYVNTDNEFTYGGVLLSIDESVEEYKVYNKAGTVEDYTNESYMEEVLVVTDKNYEVKFYNQNYDLIDSRLVKAKY